MNPTVSLQRRLAMFLRQLREVTKTYTSRQSLILVMVGAAFMSAPAIHFRSERSRTSVRPTAPMQVALPTQWMTDGSGFQPFDRTVARLPPGTRMLALSGSSITGDAVLDLLDTGGDSIISVDLLGTSTGPRSLRRIAQLPALLNLRLEWASVTASDLQYLAANVHLKNLTIRGVPLDRAGLSAIGQMTDLSALLLDDLHLERNADLSELSSLTSLQSLRLKHVNVSEVAVPVLQQMGHLKYLDLRYTGLSKASVDSLRKQLPQTKIEYARDKRPPTPASQRAGKRLSQAMFLLFCPLFMLVPSLAMHVRTQIVDPRSRVIPGFAGPHLTVAALILGGATIGLTLVATVGTEFSLSGVLSVVAASATALFCAGYFQSMLLSFGAIGGLLWLSLGAPDVARDWIEQEFFLKSTSPAAVGLLLGSLGTLAAVAARMSRIHEEMSEYGATASIEAVWNQRSTSAQRQQQRAQAEWIGRSKRAMWFCDHFSTWVMRHLPSQPVIRRVIQSQVAHGMAVLMLPLVLVVMFLTSQAFVSLSSGSAVGPVSVMVLTLILPMMAIAMLNGVWMQHWSWFPSELMFPLSRRDFVRSLLGGIMLDGAVVLVISELLIAVQAGRGFELRGLAVSDAWAVTAVLCGSNILSGSALVSLLLSYRSFWKLLIGLLSQTVVFAAVTAVVMESLESRVSIFPLMLPGVVCGASLMAVTWLTLAWRRWNELEFG